MAKLTYRNFDLQIERAADGYRALVIHSPGGEASRTFTLPFQRMEVENFLLRLGRTRTVRRVDAPEVAAAKTFGTRLFTAVFDDEVWDCFRASLDETSRHGDRLRIRLRLVGVPELADLPWEYLYNPALNRFLALSDRTPLVRYLELPERIRPLQVIPPLRALVMISSPSDVVELDVEREWAKLRRALGDLERRHLVVLERLDTATLPALLRRLQRGDYHIFHFIGHGGFDKHNQDGVLMLEDEHGRGHRVSGQHLGTILHDHDPLRLAVLNACEGARSADDDPFAGVAQSLVQQGTPAVVAMQFEITDEAAITFAQGFYDAIADSYPVDAALAKARQLIFSQGNGLEWATPVLFMRAPDGRIFDVAASAPQGDAIQASPAPSDNREQQQHLGELYTKALAAFYTERWAEAIDLLEKIVAQRTDYEDAASKLEEAKQQGQLVHHYVEGLRAAEAHAWAEAITHWHAVQRIDPTYTDVGTRLAEAKRQKTLAELYAEAQRLHQAQAWQAVLNVFARIQALDAAYPDPNDLLTSARAALAAEVHQQHLATFYSQGLRSINAGDWAAALNQFEEIQRLEPRYRQTEALLQRIRQELAMREARMQQQAEEEARNVAEQRMDALYAQAHASFKTEQWDQAITLLNEIVAQQADYKDAASKLEAAKRQQHLAHHYVEGQRAAEAHAWAEAITHWHAVHSVEPTYKDTAVRLEAAQHQAQNWYEVKDNFGRIHKLDPQYPDPEGLLASAQTAQAVQEREQHKHNEVAVPQWGNRALFGQWVLGSIISNVLAVMLASVLYGEFGLSPTVSVVTLYICGVVAPVSTVQGLLLWHHLKRVGWWVLSSTLAVTVVLGVTLVSPLSFSTEFSLFLPTGAAIAVAQWLLLRQRLRRAGWWIVGSSIGWAINLGLVYNSAYHHDSPNLVQAELVQATLYGGVGMSVFTGVVLVLLLRTEMELATSTPGTSLQLGNGAGVQRPSVALPETWSNRLWWGPLMVGAALALPALIALVGNIGGARDRLTSYPLLLGTLSGHSVSFSPDGQTLASAPVADLVTLHRISDGSELRTLEGHNGSVYEVAFAPDGQTLAVAAKQYSTASDGDYTVTLWQVNDGTRLQTFTVPITEDVAHVVFTPDVQMLAVGSTDGTVTLWRVSDGSVVNTLELQGHSEGLFSIAFAPNGEILASRSRSGPVKLWRVSDGSLVHTLEGHTDGVDSVVFAPDGQTLAVGLGDGTVQLWRVGDGTLLRTLQGHTSDVAGVAFAPDGQTLASGSRDATVKLWRVSDGSLVRTLARHSEGVDSVAFAPDGQMLASVSFDGVQLWQVEP